MHQMPLEYRILTALVIGTATLSELALRLGSPRRPIEHRVLDLVAHRAIRVCGKGDWHRIGRPGHRFELTKAGKEWAIEMIGGVE
jgi:predicted ArsR family transcriptional regulator